MINLPKNTSLRDFTLLIPSTCVGNVSQLTTDLLIENLKMQKLGDIFHNCVPPLVGLSAFEHITDKITTAAEIYSDSGKKLAVLQIRTPLAPPLMADFFQKLCDFVKEQEIKQVIILTACYGYEKHSVQASDFAYQSNKELTNVVDLDKTSKDKILGGGYAVKLFETLNQEEIDTIILYKYVSEGDNIPDAVALLVKLNQIVKFLDVEASKKVLMPISWKYLFGNRPPIEIY